MQRPLDRHTAIVLFYKYFVCESDEQEHTNVNVDASSKQKLLLIQRYSDYYIDKVQNFVKTLCTKLQLKGRILLATEGINGTISGFSTAAINQFIAEIEKLDLLNEFGFPTDVVFDERLPPSEFLFRGIDWKISSTNSCVTSTHDVITEPFPDLKIVIVKEIISTGGSVSVHDIMKYGGTHLSPTEFHQCIVDHPDAVLIDVRNTFEHAIGHFVHPSTKEPACNPEMVHFSSFESTFCSVNAQEFRNKKVLMYCTGGIRCEKASVMLKQRGISDVSQLSGGIHRYLETFGNSGFFRGKNFVFDQRVIQNPLDYSPSHFDKLDHSILDLDSSDIERDEIVGECLECHAKYDELCGSRVCTVCRDLVLVCPECQRNLREYHCARHASWKKCYFTFLEVFDRTQLLQQHENLLDIRNIYLTASKKHKNVRRTLSKQISKIMERITALENGIVFCDRSAPRRCRTCMEPDSICDGKCWGFWKTTVNRQLSPTETGILPLPVGTFVEPGPNWNDLRLGSKLDCRGMLLRGVVLEVKTWGSGGSEFDCAAVSWMNQANEQQNKSSLIYRWGAIALNGRRMYDLQRVDHSANY